MFVTKGDGVLQNGRPGRGVEGRREGRDTRFAAATMIPNREAPYLDPAPKDPVTRDPIKQGPLCCDPPGPEGQVGVSVPGVCAPSSSVPGSREQ